MKKLYACGVDWQHEMEHVPALYNTVEELKQDKECWVECGIVELEIKCVRWVEKQDFEHERT